MADKRRANTKRSTGKRSGTAKATRPSKEKVYEPPAPSVAPEEPEELKLWRELIDRRNALARDREWYGELYIEALEMRASRWPDETLDVVLCRLALFRSEPERLFRSQNDLANKSLERLDEFFRGKPPTIGRLRSEVERPRRKKEALEAIQRHLETHDAGPGDWGDKLSLVEPKQVERFRAIQSLMVLLDVDLPTAFEAYREALKGDTPKRKRDGNLNGTAKRIAVRVVKELLLAKAIQEQHGSA